MVKNGSKLFYLVLFEEEGPLPELYIPPILLPPDTTLLSPYGNIRNMSQLTIQVTDAISVSCFCIIFRYENELNHLHHQLNLTNQFSNQKYNGNILHRDNRSSKSPRAKYDGFLPPIYDKSYMQYNSR